MDIAKIELVKEDNGRYPFVTLIDCDMPSFGQMSFKIYSINEYFFLQYADYPIVQLVGNCNLYEGIHTMPYKIYIIPPLGESELVTYDNINNFYISVIHK